MRCRQPLMQTAFDGARVDRIARPDAVPAVVPGVATGAMNSMRIGMLGWLLSLSGRAEARPDLRIV